MSLIPQTELNMLRAVRSKLLASEQRGDSPLLVEGWTRVFEALKEVIGLEHQLSLEEVLSEMRVEK